MHRAVHAGDVAEIDDPHVALEAVALDDLARAAGVHADDAAVAQVEHVAGVLQLVLGGDGDDGEALAAHVGRKLDGGAAQGVPAVRSRTLEALLEYTPMRNRVVF